MTDRGAVRLGCEVVFLGGLAAALAYARLGDAEIVGVMALGWLLVAALEWAAWRGRPHYASGLPPRYYVPRTDLPPPVVVEQRRPRPRPRPDDAPTWVAPPAVRTEVLGAWPLASPERGDEVSAPTVVDPWLASSLPAEPLPPPRRPKPVRDVVPAEPPVPPVPPVPYDGPTALHTLDPFAEPAGRRRRGRAGDPPLRVSVPAGPPATRGLPGTADD